MSACHATCTAYPTSPPRHAYRAAVCHRAARATPQPAQCSQPTAFAPASDRFWMVSTLLTGLGAVATAAFTLIAAAGG